MLTNFDFTGKVVRIREDRYVSATDMASAVGKKFNVWYRAKSTEEFLKALSDVLGIPVTNEDAQGKTQYVNSHIENNANSTGITGDGELDADSKCENCRISNQHSTGDSELDSKSQCENCRIEKALIDNRLSIVEVNVGGDGEGTWIHPKAAIQFAMWCQPYFGVQVSIWIDELLSKGVVSLDVDQRQQQKLQVEQPTKKSKKKKAIAAAEEPKISEVTNLPFLPSAIGKELSNLENEPLPLWARKQLYEAIFSLERRIDKLNAELEQVKKLKWNPLKIKDLMLYARMELRGEGKLDVSQYPGRFAFVPYDQRTPQSELPLVSVFHQLYTTPDHLLAPQYRFYKYDRLQVERNRDRSVNELAAEHATRNFDLFHQAHQQRRDRLEEIFNFEQTAP